MLKIKTSAQQTISTALSAHQTGLRSSSGSRQRSKPITGASASIAANPPINAKIRPGSQKRALLRDTIFRDAVSRSNARKRPSCRWTFLLT